MTSLSGTQFSITSGPYTADIASVGATLRTLRHDGRDLVAPFEADELRPDYRGAVLVPWPNRVVDGHWSFDGVDYELAITEPKRGHALHGLATWLDFDLAQHEADRVRLTAHIPAQAGYPFPLSVEVEYSLDNSGLTTTVTTANTGTSPAPYGVGPHPYLVAGTGLIDEWTLELPAAQIFEVGDRLIPTELLPVTAENDFRQARSIGATQLDHAFTELTSADDGRVTARLLAADGHGVEMSWADDLGWVQVFTSDFPAPVPPRRAVAVEPMSCPPDAFNSGTDLIVLQPESSHTAQWRITAI